MGLLENRKHNFWPTRIAGALLLVVVVGSMVLGLLSTQRNSKKAIEERFALRSVSASTFLDSYVQYTLDREQELAKFRLNTDEVSRDQFLDFLDNFGFGPSVLLDDEGRIINIAPYKEELIGKNITEENPHLKAAVENNEQTVSNVIPSDALKFPNVAFATPFETQAGRRILSGAYDLTTKPLGNYFENIVPSGGSSAYMVDEFNNVIASNKDESGTLASLDTELSEVLSKQKEKGIQTRGYYENARGEKTFFTTQLVPNTPWKIITTIEADVLFKSESGSKTWLPWLYIACFALVASALVVIFIRNREKRIVLQDVSLIDLLTGVYNPRGVKLHLKRLISASRRHNNDLSIFKIDIDNFKEFNEKYGNGVGDEILVGVAQEIQSRLRAEDILGRCGGEEFIVILPDTDINGASIVAERIRIGVEQDVSANTNENAKATISIGIAGVEKEDTIDTFSERAEKALADSKSSGKNKVSMSNEKTAVKN